MSAPLESWPCAWACKSLHAHPLAGTRSRASACRSSCCCTPCFPSCARRSRASCRRRLFPSHRGGRTAPELNASVDAVSVTAHQLDLRGRAPQGEGEEQSPHDAKHHATRCRLVPLSQAGAKYGRAPNSVLLGGRRTPNMDGVGVRRVDEKDWKACAFATDGNNRQDTLRCVTE